MPDVVEKESGDIGAAMESGSAGERHGEISRPFDSSELERLPQPGDDDPPYQSWWVVQ